MSTQDNQPPWKAIAQWKQEERESRIPQEWRLDPNFIQPEGSTASTLGIPRTCGILNTREITITESYDATSLAAAIAYQTYTSEEVAVAFCKRAAIAQQLSNCLTEILFADAIKRAQWLDTEFKRTGKPTGPFHGLPISVKDSFKIKGYDASIGIAALALNPATTNSELVDTLLSLGAVLHCKTNIPQTLMALDSFNNVFGRTLNPRNPVATAGGSSGGEGALLALRGSILGVGTDIGGSIRIPAMCNGIYGVKPSAERIPFIAQEGGVRPGISQLGLRASAGPITHSLRDSEFFLKSISDSRPWERDPAVVFGPWTHQGAIGEKPLVGIIRTDNIVTPLPPVSAVLEETVQKLKASGVELIEIAAPHFRKCQSLTNKFYGIDGENFTFDILEKTEEPLHPWLVGKVARRPQMSINKLSIIHNEKAELEKEMLEIWKDPATGRRVDAIICPVAPHPTPAIDRWNGVGYTISFVMLDYPAGTIPVRDVVESDLEREFSGEEGELGNSWEKVNRKLWDPKTVNRKDYLNTKLAIQVVAPRMQERRLLQAMTLIDTVLLSNKTPGISRNARL